MTELTATTTVSPGALRAKLEGRRTLFAYLIFLQAFLGLVGSMYYSTFGDPVANLLARNLFSTDNGLAPCELCWFARVLLYPIAFVSFIAMIKNDHKFTHYILPMAILGIGLESYHYGLQKFGLASVFGCSVSNPCTSLQVQYLGFITLPLLALVAFVSITVLCVWHLKIDKRIEKL